jgi:hypothetical protein
MHTANTCSWLILLADPTGVQRPLPATGLRDDEWADLFSWADGHGVLPATVANLKAILRREGPQRLVASRPRQADPHERLERALEAAGSMMRQRIAITGILKSHSEGVRQAMARDRLPAIIIKGCDFADRLYAHPSLRPYRDIDLLVPPAAAGRAEQVLRQLGYRPADESGGKYAGEYGESAWRLAAPPQIVVELHWNLVNSPSQRRVVSVGYDDLQLESLHRNGLTYQQPTPASILLLSAIHAGIGHRFDRLQLLCDIGQVCRGVAGPIDLDWLRETIARTGGRGALAIALHLVGSILQEPLCDTLCDRLQLGRLGLSWRLLLGKSLVLRSNSPFNKLRRQVLREILKRAA